jgi:hypothetical protein
MSYFASKEFRYTSFNFSDNSNQPSDGEFTFRMGDFSIRSPLNNNQSEPEFVLLTASEKKAYQMRWDMKGHPRLYSMVGAVLGCSEDAVGDVIQQISLKIRYNKILSPN